MLEACKTWLGFNLKISNNDSDSNRAEQVSDLVNL